MPPKQDSTAWTNEHQLSVLRHIVASSLAARPALYAQPQMAGVNGNGGSRINQKLQATLALLVKQFPEAEGMIKDEVAKLSGGKAGAGGAAGGARPRENKRKKSDDEDEVSVKEE
ncbi:uncharacterized protein LOC62_03G004355 [Vanrija pseudolonga]|uniref:Uncharacterized protein n=1 Tax=Vanrija pseudolonga TaxID=143232 RepID=A0AAF0Y6F9_9TREE|nr:hypothetical protein LOC62_03G004355 [Vanrija pseudolonga]